MNILIIEDENKTASLLKEMIEEQEHCLVVNICQSISSSVQYLTKNQEKIDLIFMDILLADGESFEIFKQITVTKPVIFCTAYDNYMLKAFKNNGIDYILKPFQQKDINAALDKIGFIKLSLSKINDLLEVRQTKPKTYQQAFIVESREKLIPVFVADIAIFILKNEHVYAIQFNGEKVSIFKPLDEIELSINPSIFFRINRQMIVNRKAIKDIEPFFNRKVIINLTVESAEKIIVSRLRVSDFKKWIENPEL
ncbi:LytR/AlgR family response regulator transcription factor [Arcicella rigui]|uniref:LytTR family DNA-binding domain-containing protein n=1 Tax=Arcicella rigui TaxID=797020 RepID=A0ABU5Q865_9BACT|nr:LytTR family DNA-binding domain-containing protein [Arcicella rigui]MEA5139035.1 LytTR family DNA-binding domain-containing protein [Arcicella rigui]